MAKSNVRSRHRAFLKQGGKRLHDMKPLREDDFQVEKKEKFLTKRLLLVDFENVHHVDLSPLDASYRAIVFLGAKQDAPRALNNARTAHRFERVSFHRVSGTGKNALDFHIAFHLGRVIENAPHTVCFVVSRDKGFDPLMSQVNSMGLNCRRVGSFAELVGLVCPRCNKDVTVAHNGGRWCSNCASFSVEPIPGMAPVSSHSDHPSVPLARTKIQLTCGWCYQPGDMSGGIYDDGEWMCGSCASGPDESLFE